MPARLFGLDFGRVASPSVLDTKSSLPQTKPSLSSTDGRRSSMDFRRPALHLAKRPNSTTDKNDRSRSKDNKRVSKDEEKHASLRPRPVTIDLIMESPPVLMIDAPQHSSGALISGRLRVFPHADEAILEKITMYLECTTTTKRPVHDRCNDCMSQVKDLYEWNFLTRPTTFTTARGEQQLPFSHLIPGHLPATTHGTTGSLDYSLHVRARTADGEEVEYRRDLIIKRALRPGNDKNSVRVFPPTNLTLNVTLPNVVHPIGEFPVICRMTGIVTSNEDSYTRWRLRKLTWRIEEHEVAVSPACAAHAHKVGGPGKGVQHEHTREIGIQELKSGWKTDFSDGTVNGEFMAHINPSSKSQRGVDSQHGLKITHNLVIECVIAEEWAPRKKPHQATPTGAARVLRTQFALHLTDRAGMGIAWDDEQPPMYEDVPASPPHYQTERTQVEDYHGDDLHDDVQPLNLGP